MKIVQLRIRGLGPAPETKWIHLKAGLNLVSFASPETGRRFLQAVQTINPPYDCRSVMPFADYPLQERRNGYTRQISPGRRTIAMSVFNTEPDLVRELGEITPLLYETDRIEVGRRLDYRRWINFVEIASSTRWGEVSADIQHLLENEHTSARDRKAIHQLIKVLDDSDRIKGDLAEQLESWLIKLNCMNLEGAHIDDILEQVRRSSCFSEARGVVEKKLPHLVMIEPEKIASAETPAVNHDRLPGHRDMSSSTIEEHLKELLPEATTETSKWQTLTMLERLQAICSNLISVSKHRRQTLPIFLFDLHDTPRSGMSEEEIGFLLGSLANHCQCLCLVDDSWSTPDNIEALLIKENDININGQAT